ncbi:hypothetical protein HDU93_004891 [Gonapodya sp. JEL0774]|nr:hypothetical protein HDU93_004891 [Gonapodya sp. JEL0774]
MPADFRGYVPVQAFTTDPRMARAAYEQAAYQSQQYSQHGRPRATDSRYDGPSTDVAHSMQRDDGGRSRWPQGFQFPPDPQGRGAGSNYQGDFGQPYGQMQQPQSKSRFHDPRCVGDGQLREGMVFLNGPDLKSIRVTTKYSRWSFELSVWVGNVPPDTSSQELYNFFSDIDVESIYVVPKSRCAFINLYTEEQVIDLVRRYHESVFRNGRILLRPQKESPRYAAAYTRQTQEPPRPMTYANGVNHSGPRGYLPSPAGTPGASFQPLPSGTTNGQGNVPQVFVGEGGPGRFFVMRSM